MRKRLFLVLSAGFLFSSAAHAFTRSGFDSPESFIADPETGSYYVSNINGPPASKDNNGYISKISASGNLVIQKFIASKNGEPVLNGPKGLLVLGKELWAADIDEIKIFDKNTGKPLRTLSAEPFNAKFLNDLAADGDGKVYVSDMLGDQILKIDPANDYKITVFKRSEELGNPNGLIFNPKSKSLMVVTFKSGEILEIDHHGKIHVLKKGLSALDGVDYDNNGNLYVSSFGKGEIYQIPFYGRGTLSIFQNSLTTPSDISCDRKRQDILVPSFRGNAVTTFFIFDKSRQKEIARNS